MSDETTTTEATETAAPATGDIDASELAIAEAGRVRGPDGKWLSRAAQAKGGKPEPKPESKPEPDAPEPGEAKPEPEPKAEPKPEPEVVKSEKLRKVLELEARAQTTLRNVEQREAEVVKFYETAKQYEQELSKREKALAEREKTWTPDSINADPVGWLLDHNVDPDRLLQAIASGDGKRKPKPERDQRDDTIAQLQARLDRLENEEPAWLRKQREQEAAHAQANRQAEAAKWFVSQAEAHHPAILAVYEPEEVPEKIVGLMRAAAAKGEAVDDGELLRRLEASCRSKLDRITSMTGQQAAKAKGQASGGTENQPREPETTISAALSGQRAAMPQKRSRAERLKEAGELKI